MARLLRSPIGGGEHPCRGAGRPASSMKEVTELSRQECLFIGTLVGLRDRWAGGELWRREPRHCGKFFTKSSPRLSGRRSLFAFDAWKVALPVVAFGEATPGRGPWWGLQETLIKRLGLTVFSRGQKPLRHFIFEPVRGRRDGEMTLITDEVAYELSSWKEDRPS